MSRFILPYQSVFDINGHPLDGAKLYFYETGTNTPKDTYSDEGLTTPNANPVVANNQGEFDDIFLSGAYRVELKDKNDVTQPNYPADNVPGETGDTALDIAALKLIEGRSNQRMEVLSYYTPNFALAYPYDGGGGTFVWDATSVETDNGGTIIKATAVTTGRWIRVFSGVVNVKWFGATGDNSTDDTTTLQNAINYVESVIGKLFAPSGIYINTGLTLTYAIELFGEGSEKSIFRLATGTGATIDAITISPAANTDAAGYGYNLHDFGIDAQSGTPGRHGIGIDITTYLVAYSFFTRLRIKALGSRGIAVLPNATPLTDGFFTSTIRGCLVQNGIYLDKAGDSIKIENNQMGGNNVGVYADLVTGAHGLSITGNNITSDGGTLLVLSADSGVFARNNCEMPTPSGVTNSAMVDIEGLSSNDVDGFVVRDNFIGSAIASYDPIRANYSRGAIITNNVVTRPTSAVSYRIAVNASGTYIVDNADTGDEALSTLIDDLGTNTLLVRQFGGNMDITANLLFAEAEKTAKWVDSAGTAIPCAGLSAIDDTFKIGCIDAPATNGHLLFFANGVEVGRSNPDGRWGIGGAGDSTAILALQSTTLGFLPPVMTTAQKNAITTPQLGLVVFDSTLSKLCVFGASGWETVTSV